ncbi:MAG TPA: hypothetical protein EYN06_00725, partial [Myxococcales bacterium]|nr:hypothetical protein [Myxococcales bacterium]
PWFNGIMVPFGVLLLLLTAVGPLIAWRRTTLKSFKNVFVPPLLLSTVPMFVGTIGLVVFRSYSFAGQGSASFSDGYSAWATTLGAGDIYAFFSIWFSSFVIVGVAVEFWRGGRVRQRSKGGSLLGNIATLTLKAKRRYGGYIIHIGVAMVFLGFTGAAFKDQAPETPMHLGDSVQCGNYKLTYVKMTDQYMESDGYVSTSAVLVATQPGETVPASEVDRIAQILNDGEYAPFHIETKANSAKLMVRFADRENRDRVREAFYLTTIMPERFTLSREEPALNRMWFTFKDAKMIRVFPPLIHKQMGELRRVLGGLTAGRATVKSTPGKSLFSITWQDSDDYDIARDWLRAEEPFIAGALLTRINPTEDALEIVTESTGYLLNPEVRRYIKGGNPTTEVDIWSRPHEDVYVAMRPDLTQPFVQLIAVINPMILLLWLGTVVMFLGGVFLLFPTDIFLARAQRSTTGNAAE